VTSSVDNFGEVFNEVANRINIARDTNGRGINVYSIMATTSTRKTYVHYFKREGSLQELRSLSKPVVGLALGTAMDKGLILVMRD